MRPFLSGRPVKLQGAAVLTIALFVLGLLVYLLSHQIHGKLYNSAKHYIPGFPPPRPPRWMVESAPQILNSATSPRDFPCAPLHFQRNSSRISNPWVLLATFSTSNSFTRRGILRSRRLDSLRQEDLPLVNSKFIIGQPRPEDLDGGTLEELELRIQAEQDLWGDLIRLPVVENLDDGKTYAFLQELVRRGDQGLERPHFVLKVDEDTLLNLPAFLNTLVPLDMSRPIYWGTSVASCVDNCFSPYFEGMAYGLSWPLVEYLGRLDLPDEQVQGTEDARTGMWMRDVDLRAQRTLSKFAPDRVKWEEETVQRVDVFRRMNNLEKWWVSKGLEFVGWHNLKNEQDWLSAWAKARQLYENAGVPFEWTQGEVVHARP